MDRHPELSAKLPPSLAGLAEIAANLWWSWNPAARMLFKNIDRQAWKETGHNPVMMLHQLPAEVFEAAARRRDYLRHYQRVLARFHNYMAEKGCRYLPPGPQAHNGRVAYFSAEYGLHHSIPFYAGGLGFLAGDFIKECSDLNVPLVAVGFMYPEGYVRQQIREDGWQENLDQPLDRDAASITRLVDDSGEQVVVKIPLIDPPIHVAVWKIDVGRIELYLLDTDIDRNDPWNRRISAQLYSGDVEQRLRQEIVLGIGGSEILDRLDIRHTVLHLNEGHAAFALLEQNGWIFGDTDPGDGRDAVDAQAIYRLLEKEVVPLYYSVSEGGIPEGWVRVMKASIKSNAARFSARRMVKEYIEKFYRQAFADA